MSTTDRIVLRDLSFYGYHGCLSAERELGQRFLVDLALSLDLEPAGTSDDLTKTVNYSAVFGLAREIVEGPPCNLIETVAERIAGAILERTSAQAVWVNVRKPRAPISGMVNGEVSVEISRQKR